MRILVHPEIPGFVDDFYSWMEEQGLQVVEDVSESPMLGLISGISDVAKAVDEIYEWRARGIIFPSLVFLGYGFEGYNPPCLKYDDLVIMPVEKSCLSEKIFQMLGREKNPDAEKLNELLKWKNSSLLKLMEVNKRLAKLMEEVTSRGR